VVTAERGVGVGVEQRAEDAGLGLGGTGGRRLEGAPVAPLLGDEDAIEQA
jgi:hypothetical protein